MAESIRRARCEDDPAVIEKYGDHSQDFKPKKITTDGQRERDFDYNPLNPAFGKNGKGSMLTDSDRQPSADLDSGWPTTATEITSGWLEQVVSCGR